MELAIILFAFLAVTLPIAAIRACNTLRAHDAKQTASKPVPTRYTGPLYSRHGTEL